MDRAADASLSSPHVHKGATTAKMTWSVTLCLLPAAAWGVFVFGLPALRTVAVAALVSVLAELIMCGVTRRAGIGDGSAVLTGLLVGLSLPPSVPVFVPATASAFAVVVAKWAFGGFGANWINPALAGRLFVFLSWRELMGRFTAPRLWGLADGVTAATPLALLARAGERGAAALRAPLARAAAQGLTSAPAQGYGFSSLDRAVTEGVNRLIGLRDALPAGSVDLVLGIRPGSIGEVSSILLVAGAIYLIGKRIVAWEIPVSFVSSLALLAWVFGGQRYGLGLFHGNVAVHLLGGGLLLGALYMAADPVTSPLTPGGMALFGAGCGALTFLVRSLGIYPEGVAFAIVLMNMLVPWINRLTERRGRAPRRR